MGAMARLLVAAACLLVPTGAAGVASVQRAETRGDTIVKVIKLLKEIMEKSTEDSNKDREQFAKFKCYCDENTAEKTKSVEDLTKTIKMLSNEIGELQADTAKRSTENGELAPIISENEEARESAQKIRDNEHDSFVAEEADMKSAMDQMKQAIDTLSAIGADQTASLLSTRRTVSSAKEQLDKLKSHVDDALKAASVFATQKQRRKLTSFIQAPFTGQYQAQSGEIMGILKNMEDTFKANLKEATEKEAAALANHEAFTKVKTSNYDEMKATSEENEKIMGSNDDSLSSKKSSKDEAEKSLSDDSEFLAKLEKMCATTTKQYEMRKMIRSGEVAAVSQAIAILNSESAVESFGKTKSGAAASFLQVERHSRRHRHLTRDTQLNQVKHFAQRRAMRLKSMRLAKVAAMLEMGSPFTKVIGAVKGMMVVIEKEEKADDDQKAWCDSERETSDSDHAEKVDGITSLKAQIEQLDDDVNNVDSGLKKQKKDEETTLKENRVAQKDSIKARKEENMKYQAEVLNLIEAEETLKKALKVLKKFYDWMHKATGPHHYEKKEGKDSGGSNIRQIKEASVEDLEAECSAEPTCAGFNTAGYLKSAIQEEGKWFDAEESLYVKVYESENPVGLLQRAAGREDPAPPSVWGDENEIGQANKATDVVSMLSGIMDDTLKEEQETHMDEESSQHAFEDEMDTLKADEQKSLDTITELDQTIAQKEADIESKHVDREQTEKEKKALERYLEKIKPGCDFITENIDTRKDNRKAELKALEEALDLLKGTPAFKAAEAADEKEALGECAVKCSNRDSLECVACISGVTVSAYCAGHDHPDC